MTYRLGRRPAPAAPAMRLSRFVAGVPDLPRRADYLRDLDGWAMLGNDRAGDCEAVRWANSRRLVTATLTDAERYPSQDDVWALYRTQNPNFDPHGDPNVNGPGSGADQGMSTQETLDYLHRTGGPDGVKAVAFARLDPLNEAEVDAAMGIFGEIWLDVVVQQAQFGQFDGGRAWDYVAGSPTEGGHAVLGGAYSWGRSNSLGFITWAQQTHMTDLYRQTCVDAAWVVIWPELLGSKAFRTGIDTTRLADYYRAITGREINWGDT